MLSIIHYGEFYPSFVNCPGRIVYDYKEDFFTSLYFEGIIERPSEWIEEEITNETLRRCIPHTRRYFLEYNCLLILKKEIDHEIWYKVALQNPRDKTIAIITTTNSNDNLRSRGIRDGVKTLEGKWVMARYRTTAPLYFWFQIHKRIITQILDTSLDEVFENLNEYFKELQL